VSLFSDPAPIAQGLRVRSFRTTLALGSGDAHRQRGLRRQNPQTSTRRRRNHCEHNTTELRRTMLLARDRSGANLSVRSKTNDLTRSGEWAGTVRDVRNCSNEFQPCTYGLDVRGRLSCCRFRCALPIVLQRPLGLPYFPPLAGESERRV